MADIVALNAKRHRTGDFACGVARLDNFLKLNAKKQQASQLTRVFVVAPAGRVVGYYALSVGEEPASWVPALARRTRRDAVPTAYLSMIAVDAAHQGEGLGRALMADALARVARVSGEVGVAALVLDAIDDDGAAMQARRVAYYETFGFRRVEGHPTAMVLAVKDIRAAMGL